VPAADWAATLSYTVTLRAGAVFPGDVTNQVDVLAEHDGLPAAAADTGITIQLSTGTPRIDVRKEVDAGGIKEVQPGEPYPWTLQVTNTGTSFITVNEIVDERGPSLRYDGAAPAYDNTDAGGRPAPGITVRHGTGRHLPIPSPA